MKGIMAAEKEKKLIRLTIWLLTKKLGVSVAEMQDDLDNCGNPVFQKMYQVLLHTSNQIQRRFQQKSTLEIGTVFLWILYRDTAYRDPAYYAIFQMLRKSFGMDEAIKEYVKLPDEWYVNVWDKTKKRTEEKRKNGEIPERSVSHEEEIFITGKQKKKLKELK